METKDINNK